MSILTIEEPEMKSNRDEKKEDARRRVERAIKMTLRVFRHKGATPEEREAAEEVLRRCLRGGVDKPQK